MNNIVLPQICQKMNTEKIEIQALEPLSDLDKSFNNYKKGNHKQDINDNLINAIKNKQYQSANQESLFIKQYQNNNINDLYCYSSPQRVRSKRQLHRQRHTTNPSCTMAEENQVKNYSKISSQFQDEEFPINQPQRIELPLFFNTPVRRRNHETIITQRKNKLLPSISPNKEIISPNSNNKYAYLSFSEVKGSKHDSNNQSFDTNIINNVSAPLNDGINLQVQNIQNKEIGNFARAIKRIRDYQFLAFACKRAGKTRDEGRSYYSIGVLYDNIGKYKHALTYYKKFLFICQHINDLHGQSLAHNCIGVDYQLLSEQDPKYLDDAIYYHKQHLSLSDVNGQFLSNINLGICYDKKKETKQSLFHYQEALQQAIRMNTLIGQSVVIGNIGKVGHRGILLNNSEKVCTFISKFIQMAKQMNNVAGQFNGHIKLGEITCKSATKRNTDIVDGRESFIKALEIADNQGNNLMAQKAKCGFAIANAESTMDEFLEQVKQVLSSSKQG